MEIKLFNIEHIERAQEMALSAYQREREVVPCLPLSDTVPELSEFAGNGMSVAAVEDGQLTAFLCAYPPFDNAFGTTGVKGVYVPPYGHGNVSQNRSRLYGSLYEAAARLWVEAGAVSHTITLYAHDKEAVNLFFHYGFGLRCVDAAMATADGSPYKPMAGYAFRELDKFEAAALFPLNALLNEHFMRSPLFMNFGVKPTPEHFAAHALTQGERYFAASHGKSSDKSSDKRYVAYIKIGRDGEHFITTHPTMANIRGAYCLPDYRGTGLFQNLLAFVNSRLLAEGCVVLGVDYESFNPAGRGFWEKHFTPYTASLVRRIDEYALREL